MAWRCVSQSTYIWGVGIRHFDPVQMRGLQIERVVAVHVGGRHAPGVLFAAFEAHAQRLVVHARLACVGKLDRRRMARADRGHVVLKRRAKEAQLESFGGILQKLAQLLRQGKVDIHLAPPRGRRRFGNLHNARDKLQHLVKGRRAEAQLVQRPGMRSWHSGRRRRLGARRRRADFRHNRRRPRLGHPAVHVAESALDQRRTGSPGAHSRGPACRPAGPAGR